MDERGVRFAMSRVHSDVFLDVCVLFVINPITVFFLHLFLLVGVPLHEKRQRHIFTVIEPREQRVEKRLFT